jgi:electron transfer flavoprotein beta subunit
MAMGADRGVLLSDPALAGSDTLATSSALAAAIQKLAPFDLVFFGTRTSDSDTGQVGPQTAVLLDLPFVSGVVFLDSTDNSFQVVRRSDGFQETYRVSPPAALTIHPTSVQARDAGLANIGMAYEARDVEKWGVKTLGLSPERVGEAGSPTRVISMTRAHRERACKFIEGEPEEQAESLIQHLFKAGLIG